MSVKKFILVQILSALSLTTIRAQNIKVNYHHRIDISHLYKEASSHILGVSVSAEKKVYFIDAGLNRVMCCDSSGVLLNEIGGFGWDLAQFDRPLDIWAKNALDVYVADYNNSRIQRFDRNLNFVTAIIGEALEPQNNQFAFPVALALADFGDLFIIEQELNRVIQFDETGQVKLTFGDFDEGEGRLVEPVAMCISDENEIYIVDRQRKSILKFDYYGNILQAIEIQSLLKPQAISYIQNHLALLDAQNNLLFILSKNGEQQFKFSPELLDEMNKSAQITDICTGRNRLYVLNDAAKWIDVYAVTTRK